MATRGGTLVARRTTALFVALVCVLTVAPSSFAAEDLRERLEETNDRISSREADLERTQAELAAVGEKIRQSDAELNRLKGELAELERKLSAAEAAYSQAQERTRQATVDLQRLAGRLESTRQRLEDRQETFGNRVAAAYKYGRVSYAEALMGSKDISDFMNTAYYIRSVMDADRHVIREVTEATLSLAEDRGEADRLREQVVADERIAKERRAEVERLTASHRKVTDMVAAERQRREALQAELFVEEAATEAEIAELEAESEELAEELRRSQWRAGAPGSGSWVWPTSGHITSGYGYRTHPIYGSRRMHTGLDISGSYGQAIVAANGGLVISAYCSAGGYGCRVVIDHGGGVGSLYAHQSQFAVAEGQVVSPGQVIGYVGSTGASTGPHLHFEIRVNGSPVDPRQYY